MSSTPDIDFDAYVRFDSEPSFRAETPADSESAESPTVPVPTASDKEPAASSSTAIDQNTMQVMDKALMLIERPEFAKPLYRINAAPSRPYVDNKSWHHPFNAAGQSTWAHYAPVLNPNPSTTSPPHPKLSFPSAPSYTLLTNDWRFRQGCAYYAPYYTASKVKDRTRILATVNPPGVNPHFSNGTFENTPIDGMVQMPLGIPFGVALDDDLARWVTVACAHSLESLKAVMDAATFTRVESLSSRLWDITWGAGGRTPIYMLPGLIRNNRSSKAPPGGGPDGSYNLASTLENRGDGLTVPAVQASSLEARNTIGETLEIISELYSEVMTYSISNEESSLTTFRDIDMNVFSIGRPYPGPTSVQQNVSSASKGGGLAEFIGKIQGQWHADVHDHHARWTLLILLFRLPPGSDMGAFLLARPAYMFGRRFNPMDTPSVNQEIKAAFLDELAKRYNNSGDQNRCGFVGYPNAASVDRSVPLAATAPTGLGNDSVLRDGRDEAIHNYAQDGIPALGNTTSHMTRLLWEDYARSWNSCVQYNIRLPEFHTQFQLLKEETIVTIQPPPLHPIRDFYYIRKMREAYKRFHLDSDEYYMRIDKASYHSVTDPILQLLREEAASTSTSTSPTADNTRMTSAPDKESPFTAAPRGFNAMDESTEEDVGQNEEEYSPRQARKKPRRQPNPASDELPGLSQPDDVSPTQSVEPATDEMEVDHEDDEADDSQGDKSNSHAGDDENDSDIEDDAEKFVISRVLRIEESECLVRWRGYDSKSDSMIPKRDVSEVLMQEYRDTLDPDNRTSLESLLNKSSTCYRALGALLDAESLAVQRNAIVNLHNDLRNQRQPASADFLDLPVLSTFPLTLQTTTKMVEDADYRINNALGLRVLDTLILACQMPEKARRAERELDVIRRAIQHISCRSFLFIYHWQVDYGIDLASMLFALGEDALQSQYPSFAALTNAIRRFVGDIRDHEPQRTTFTVEAALVPEPLRLPHHSSFSLYIQKVSDLKLKKGDAQFTPACVRIFVHFIAFNILAYALKEVDQRANRRNDDNSNLAAVYDRCLIRGAILDCLLDAVDDDGIFCADGVKDVLETPWMVLKSYHHCDKFAEKLRDTPTAHLRDFFRWLKLHPDGVDIQNHSIHMGDANKSSQPLKVRLVDGDVVTVDSKAPLAAIFPRRDMPEFGCLSIILVEVLAYLRNDARRVDTLRIEDLRPVLLGRNPITTSKMNIVPDYFNPCRARNNMHTLFCERLEGRAVTSEHGLSNILLFLGTGQGGPTSGFVKDHLQEWITSAATCTQIFESARARFALEEKARGRPQQFSNGNCWGTRFCSQLSLMDTKEEKQIDIAARCEEFFSQKVKDLWRKFLEGASMWNVGMTSIGKRNARDLPTFSKALELADKCGVRGFGEDGLTNLQLANSLALLGLCQQPTIEEMGHQVFRIKKGALVGLRLLGLDEASANNEACVIKAFRCVHTFMDQHFCQEDKDALRFGTIFSENFLCKLKRWARLFFKLRTLNKERLKGAIYGADFWKMGYPLPLYVLDRKVLEKAMYKYC
ncbi:hypothetical protein BDZ89DRAFT_1142136 [Hymenopellis radicata]|nr:hypothetical protein BDZ89DRAFT_1142136 [Hymenopellis radicata]